VFTELNVGLRAGRKAVVVS